MMLTFANLNSVAGIVPSALLVLVWWCALRSVRHSGWGIAMLTLVGTISHEALHAVVGWIFRAKPTSFSILPQRRRDCWVLGSVSFRNLNIWNSAPVAFAPLLLAWVGWLAFRHWTEPAFYSGHYISWLLSGYIVAVCLFSCIPSHIDIRMGALSGVMYVCVAGLLWAVAMSVA
jgi:hypothetical protein